MPERQPVLILGGGINGAAIARELALNHVPVVLVDTADIASGATAYSSRLIHGGVRYLEYGDFQLVNESLAERTRLLRLAPDFVKPLRLHIPTSSQWGGSWQTLRRMLGIDSPVHSPQSRGLRLIQAGLWFYDTYARDRSLPQRATRRQGEKGVPEINQSYRWVCSYSDAQMISPERFVVALLRDAEQVAAASGERFDVLTYHEAKLQDDSVTIHDRHGNVRCRVNPALIINASGAWVDHTLKQLQVTAPRLMGGTKGSHFITHHRSLVTALNGEGIYAEAQDGRPVFMLPLGNAAMVGTTDVRFEDRPEHATATEDELRYLIGAVNDVFPHLQLNLEAIDHHYAGVRPLPFSDAKKTGAVTRRHALQQHDHAGPLIVSVIGGKLTTCRSLAEETVAKVLPQILGAVTATSRDRAIPEMTPEWSTAADDPTQLNEIIHREWVNTIEDLVERRLLLLNDPQLSRGTLINLAQALVAAGQLMADEVETAVSGCQQRLLHHYGKKLAE